MLRSRVVLPTGLHLQGFWHEIGHNHQFSFSTTYMVEITCNIWSLLLSEQIMKVNRTARYTDRATTQANYFATGSECRGCCVPWVIGVRVKGFRP